MKVKLRVLIFLFLSVQNVKAQNLAKLRIDPSHAYGGTVSEYFDDVEYVPLETTKESLFGEAIKFIVFHDRYILFDPDTNALLFFNKNGKFLSKVKFKQGVWPEISGEPFAKKVYVSYHDQNSLISEVYDQDGKIVHGGKTSVPDLRSYAIYLSDSVYLINNSCYYPASTTAKNITINSLEIYNGRKLIKKFMPLNQKEYSAYCGLSPGSIVNISTGQKGIAYVSTTFNHYLYKVTKDTIQGMYQLVFPSNRTIPQSYLETKNDKLIDSLRKARWVQKDDLIVRIGNITMTDQFLFFKVEPGQYIWTESSVANAQYNFVYNLKSNHLVSFERITSDSKSYYLPISNGPRTNIDGVVNFDGYQYIPVSSLRMFNAFQKEKSKNPQYPLLLQEYFKTQNRKSNPVIVRMKLKE